MLLSKQCLKPLWLVLLHRILNVSNYLFLLINFMLNICGLKKSKNLHQYSLNDTFYINTINMFYSPGKKKKYIFVKFNADNYLVFTFFK